MEYYNTKATGVVRRIDDLGRIVLPKELRRTMRIKEGDSLEIFLDANDKIVLKKYSAIQNLNTFVKEFVESMYSSNQKDMIVTDNEKVVAQAGNISQNLVGKKISISLENKIKQRNTQIFDKYTTFEICENIVINKPAIIKPINVMGDVLGCVIVFSDSAISEVEKSLAEFSGIFMSKYLEA